MQFAGDMSAFLILQLEQPSRQIVQRLLRVQPLFNFVKEALVGPDKFNRALMHPAFQQAVDVLQTVIQANFGNRQSRACGQRFKEVHFIAPVLASLAVERVEHAEDVVLQQQRHTGICTKLVCVRTEEVVANCRYDECLFVLGNPTRRLILQCGRQLTGVDN